MSHRHATTLRGDGSTVSSSRSYGQSTFNSRAAPFRVSSSPMINVHQQLRSSSSAGGAAAPSGFTPNPGNNTSLADAVRHVYGAAASPVVVPVVHNVVASSFAQLPAEQQERRRQQQATKQYHGQVVSDGSNTFTSALYGAGGAGGGIQNRNDDNNNLNLDYDKNQREQQVNRQNGVDIIPQFEHHFRGPRQPAVNQSGIAHGGIVTRTGSKLTGFSSDRKGPAMTMEEMMNNNIVNKSKFASALSTRVLSSSGAGARRTNLLASASLSNLANQQQQQQQQQQNQNASLSEIPAPGAGGGALSHHHHPSQIPQSQRQNLQQQQQKDQEQEQQENQHRLTGEALAAAALSKIENSSNIVNSYLSASIAGLGGNNQNQNRTQAQNNFNSNISVSALASGRRPSSASSVRAAVVEPSTNRSLFQEELQSGRGNNNSNQLNPYLNNQQQQKTKSRPNSASYSGRNYSNINNNNNYNARPLSSGRSSSSTNEYRNENQQQQRPNIPPLFSDRNSSSSHEREYGGGGGGGGGDGSYFYNNAPPPPQQQHTGRKERNNNIDKRSRSRSTDRATNSASASAFFSSNLRGGGGAGAANRTSPQRQGENNNQNYNHDAVFPAPPLFYATREAAQATSVAVTAASNLFVRTLGVDLVHQNDNTAHLAAAAGHEFENGENNSFSRSSQNYNNNSAISLSASAALSSRQRTAHAEFAELFSRCEDLWSSELATSDEARQRAAFTLFPMLFQYSQGQIVPAASTTRFSSTQLASLRQTIQKYIVRLETQLELLNNANNAMLARDSAIFEIVVISKRYTDYVNKTFGSAEAWREAERVSSVAADRRSEAGAAMTDATAIKHELRVALHKYRMCTLVAIESIARWMEFTGRVDFWWQNRPALLRICVDLYQAAFSRRPVLYLLGFDIAHNPFALPSDKWMVVPRRERRLDYRSPSSFSSSSSLQKNNGRAKSSPQHFQRGPSVVSTSNVGRRSASSAAAAAGGGAASSSSSAPSPWGAQKHRSISISHQHKNNLSDPRKRSGEAQNFILMNEVGVPLRMPQHEEAVLSSARAATLQRPSSSSFSPQQDQQQSQNQSQGRGNRNQHFKELPLTTSSGLPPSSLEQHHYEKYHSVPLVATAVDKFWMQMEHDEFDNRGRMEAAMVLMRHAVLQCVVPIQSNVRRLLCSRHFARDRYLIMNLQREVKAWVLRREIDRTRRLAAALALYRFFNGYATRFVLARMRNAAIRLQSVWRGFLDRRWLQARHDAAVVLQRWTRPLVRRVINERKRDVRRVLLLQRAGRSYLSRRRFFEWAWSKLVAKRRAIKALIHTEGECRAALQLQYNEQLLGGSGALVSAASATFLLDWEELRTLPQVLRPVLAPLAAWCQLQLHHHIELFSPAKWRILFLSTIEEEKRQRIEIFKNESGARQVLLKPAKFMLMRCLFEQRCAEAMRLLVLWDLEPMTRSTITEMFRRERYALYLQYEGETRLMELINLESLRRRFLEQAEHEDRMRHGLSPLSTLVRCDFLEKQERERIEAAAAHTFAIHFQSMLPDFEALRREAIVHRWYEIVGFLSSSSSREQTEELFKQQQEELISAMIGGGRSRLRHFVSSSSSNSNQNSHNNSLPMDLLVFQASGGGGGGSGSGDDFSRMNQQQMQIAFQIELLHLSSEEQIARDSLVAQIDTAPVFFFFGGYSRLLKSMARQLSVLFDSQAYAWVKLMSWDGASALRSDESLNGENQEATVTSTRFTPQLRHFASSSSSSPDGKPPLAAIHQRAAVSTSIAGAGAASSSSVFASPQHQNQQNENNNNSNSSEFLMSDVNLASANPVLFRALITHALRLQRIGRAYRTRATFIALTFAERHRRAAIIQESIQELYVVIESLAREKIQISELHARERRKTQVRVALGFVDQLVEKRNRYRLKRLACKAVLFPAIANLHNRSVEMKFSARIASLVGEDEARARNSILIDEEPAARSEILHDYLVSAERAMTHTIRRRWDEHEELVSQVRTNDALAQRRERVLQDKIYELLMQFENEKGEAQHEMNRALAKEIAVTERIKEQLWGKAYAQQVIAYKERELLVAEKGARALLAEREADERANLGRDSAQAVFLSMCSPPRGVPLPLAFVRNARPERSQPSTVEQSPQYEKMENYENKKRNDQLLESILSPEVRAMNRRLKQQEEQLEQQQQQEQSDNATENYINWMTARRGLLETSPSRQGAGGGGGGGGGGRPQQHEESPTSVVRQFRNEVLAGHVSFESVAPWQSGGERSRDHHHHQNHFANESNSAANISSVSPIRSPDPQQPHNQQKNQQRNQQQKQEQDEASFAVLDAFLSDETEDIWALHDEAVAAAATTKNPIVEIPRQQRNENEKQQEKESSVLSTTPPPLPPQQFFHTEAGGGAASSSAAPPVPFIAQATPSPPPVLPRNQQEHKEEDEDEENAGKQKRSNSISNKTKSPSPPTRFGVPVTMFQERDVVAENQKQNQRSTSADSAASTTARGVSVARDGKKIVKKIAAVNPAGGSVGGSISGGVIVSNNENHHENHRQQQQHKRETSSPSSSSTSPVARGRLRPSSAGTVRSGRGSSVTTSSVVGKEASSLMGMFLEEEQSQRGRMRRLIQSPNQNQKNATGGEHDESSQQLQQQEQQEGEEGLSPGSARRHRQQQRQIQQQRHNQLQQLYQMSRIEHQKEQQAAGKTSEQQRRNLFGSRSDFNAEAERVSERDPLSWTAHAASRANIDVGIPEQLRRLESFAGTVQNSIQTAASFSNSKSRNRNVVAGGSGGRAAALLRRASDVLTQEELAELSSSSNNDDAFVDARPDPISSQLSSLPRQNFHGHLFPRSALAPSSNQSVDHLLSSSSSSPSRYKRLNLPPTMQHHFFQPSVEDAFDVRNENENRQDRIRQIHHEEFEGPKAMHCKIISPLSDAGKEEKINLQFKQSRVEDEGDQGDEENEGDEVTKMRRDYMEPWYLGGPPPITTNNNNENHVNQQQQQQQRAAPTTRFLLRRAHEVLSPPQDDSLHNSVVELEALANSARSHQQRLLHPAGGGGQQQQQQQQNQQQQQQSNGHNSQSQLRSSLSPPRITLQSPSIKRKQVRFAVGGGDTGEGGGEQQNRQESNRAAAVAATAAAAAAAAAVGQNNHCDNSAANLSSLLSASYKSDLPASFYF